MLVDPPIKELRPMEMQFAIENNIEPEMFLPQRVQQGVYEGHLNCQGYFATGSVMHINDPWNRKVYRELMNERHLLEWEEFAERYAMTWGIYGVADDIHQVMSCHADLVNDPDKGYVIVVTRVTRASQPKEDGWRWSKWGNYIGNHEPQHEYLYDEEGIDEVIVYHVYRARETVPDGY